MGPWKKTWTWTQKLLCPKMAAQMVCPLSLLAQLNEEPAVKKQKLGPVLDEDLIPLKAKVRR